MSMTITITGNTSVLSAVYFPPLDLSSGMYVCGLVDFQSYNSIPNINESNNEFTYGGVTMNIPKGCYEVEDIEKL